MQLKVKKLSTNAQLPTRGTPQSVGYDLYASEDVTIKSKDRGMVSTGLAIKVPTGTYGRVAPRSGLAVKSGVNVGAGVIDPDYTGEVKVVLFNHGADKLKVKAGDRVAQLIVERCETPVVEEVQSLEETSRGAGGFGSTGADTPANACALGDDALTSKAQAATKKKADEAAAAETKKKAEEAAAKKKADEAAATKKKAEEAAAAKKKADEAAAAKKKADEAAAAKKKAEEAAATKKKADEAAATKKKADEAAATKKKEAAPKTNSPTPKKKEAAPKTNAKAAKPSK